MSLDIRFEGVFFDLGNTLISFTPRESMEFVIKWYMSSGLQGGPVEFREFLETYRSVIRKERARMKEERWETDPSMRSRMMTEALRNEGVDEEELNTNLLAGHTPSFLSCLRMNSSARHVLDIISSSTTPTGNKPKLALISNAADARAIRTFLKKEDLLRYFSGVEISEEMGLAKPWPEIFERPLRKLELEPSQAVYIGDRYRTDVEGAKNIGMEAVYIRQYHTAGEPPEDIDIEGPVIENILELPDILRHH